MDFDLSADQKLFRGDDQGLSGEGDAADAGARAGGQRHRVRGRLVAARQRAGVECHGRRSGGGGDSISGEGLVDACIVAEEMGRLVSPGPLIGGNVVAAALSEAANAGDHAEVISALMAGEAVASWAVYEPGRGWSPLTPGVQAARDGSWVRVSGDKGPGRSRRSGRLVPGHRGGGGRGCGGGGVAQFIVPASAPGVTVTPEQSLDLVRRYARVEKLGRCERAAGTACQARRAGRGGGQPADPDRGRAAVAETAGVIARVFEFTCNGRSTGTPSLAGSPPTRR